MGTVHDEMLRRVWYAHDHLQLPMGEIAKRLLIQEKQVLSCIVEVWGMSSQEKLEAGITARMGEEGE